MVFRCPKVDEAERRRGGRTRTVGKGDIEDGKGVREDKVVRVGVGGFVIASVGYLTGACRDINTRHQYSESVVTSSTTTDFKFKLNLKVVTHKSELADPWTLPGPSIFGV